MGGFMTEIQELSKMLLDEWGEDHNTKNLSNKIGKFLCQLNGDKDLGYIFLELIKNYDYYSRCKLQNILESFFEVLIEQYTINESLTVYSRLETDSKINSSNSMLEEYKAINLIENEFSREIKNMDISVFEQLQSIVFIDDTIGSGNTVKSYFDENREKLKKCKIYILCITILRQGYEFLKVYFAENGFDVVIHPYTIKEKAFQAGNIFKNPSKYEKLLSDFEISLWGKKNNYILGYEDSQALVSYFNNTPNNTISSFWYESESRKWNKLFKRNKKKLDLKNRKALAYNLEKYRKDV